MLSRKSETRLSKSFWVNYANIVLGRNDRGTKGSNLTENDGGVTPRILDSLFPSFISASILDQDASHDRLTARVTLLNSTIMGIITIIRSTSSFQTVSTQ